MDSIVTMKTMVTLDPGNILTIPNPISLVIESAKARLIAWSTRHTKAITAWIAESKSEDIVLALFD